DGLADSSSASRRASANGSLISSTLARMRAAPRSATRPASSPKTSTIGRAGSGRATKASTSAALTATIVSGSGPGDEKRRQPVPDVVGDDLDRAVFGVALGALLGEALRRARDVVRHARESVVDQ